MRITHLIPSLESGGAEATLYRLVFSDNTNEHIIISLKNKGFYGKRLQQLGIKIYFLNIQNNLLNIFKIIQLLKKERPDVLQTWLYYCDFIGTIFGKVLKIKKIIWSVHYNIIEKSNVHLTMRICFFFLKKFFCFIPNKIVFCAESAKYHHTRNGYPLSKSIVISNGVDCNIFKIKKYNNKKRLLKKIFTLGFVGRFTPEKDLPTLFKSLNLLLIRGFKIQLICIGKNMSKYNAELVQLLNKFAIHKITKLKGEKKNLTYWYNLFDVLLLPSRMEAFPNVLPEAMACGTPCIVTDVGDSKIIVDSTGWVVPPQNPKMLAEAILKAYKEKYNGKILLRKKNARYRAKMLFNLGDMVKKYQKVWLNTPAKYTLNK